VLVRFAYLAVTRAFAALRLLPTTDREKGVEILSIRHQPTILQRQLADQTPTTAARGQGVSRSIRIIETPIQGPHANAIMNAGVGSIRREILDRMMIVNAPRPD
jgi:hypothetical protein